LAILSTVRQRFAELLFLGLAAGVFAWLVYDAFWVRSGTYTPSSDYWEHAAAMRALTEHPFHPRQPQVDAPVSSPRFGPVFVLAALLARPFEAGTLDAMGIASLLSGALFLAGIWCFFRTYFRDARAPLFALIVFFGSWYAAPNYSNVYSLPVFFTVAAYPSTSALGLTLLVLALGVTHLRAARARPLTLGLLTLGWALIVVTHQLTASMSLPAGLLLSFTEPDVPRRRRLELAATLVAGVALSGLWPYYPVFDTVFAGAAHRIGGGARRIVAPLHEFYSTEKLWAILGFGAMALFLLPYFFVRRRVMFAVLGALLMLAAFVLKTILPVPLGHRYILLAAFNLHILLVAALLELVPRGSFEGGWFKSPTLRRATALGVVALLGLQAFLGLTRLRERAGHRSRTRHGESPVVRLGRAIGKTAGPEAIVLGTAVSSWVVPAFGPRIVVLLHENPLVADHHQREEDARAFFSELTPSSVRDQILARYGVTHVLAPASTGRLLERYLAARGVLRDLPGSTSIYVLDAPNTAKR
jgi:hypothetical protein